jgi:MoaA/NifB/PqqE/SkfB family radical SAM enzyme
MSDFYCAAPWRGLHINPRGDVKTCCAGDPNMLGNLNQQTIEQILFSPLMTEIKQTLKKGQPHQYCYNCVQAERYGRSERDWHNSVSPEFDCQTADNNEHLPTLVDVRWNTTCNLSCNYCGESCSSKWASIKGIPIKSGARPYYTDVCDYLQHHQSSIREVALVGGEPLLLPENERLLDVIPDDCVVTLITNVSVDFATNKIVNKLFKRQKVGWSLSFDNTGPHFEYVRHGGDWSMLLNNLSALKPKMQSGQHWGGIHAVYNIYNATRILDITEFARDKDLHIHWQSLYQPNYLDPTKLGHDIAMLAKQEVEKTLQTGLSTPDETVFLNSVLANLNSKCDLRPQLRQHILSIENEYHVDKQGQFAQLWPEINKLVIQ